MQSEGALAYGPTRDQARLEWDRAYGKEIAKKLGIPIGAYAEFREPTAALEYAQTLSGWPLFVKDNYLARGKGATECATLLDVQVAIAKQFGSFVVEEFVSGPEASHHAFCDGKTHLSIPILARDHKRLLDGDKGPMTGGMGVIAGLHYSPEEIVALGNRFVQPVVEVTGFRGTLFSGLKGDKGHEKNLEWNARDGDPEMAVYLRYLQSPLLPILMACIEGNLAGLEAPQWATNHYVANIVLAAPGYPDRPERGHVIEGLEDAQRLSGVSVLHAGTAIRRGSLVTEGGRVLNVLAEASTMEGAITRAYEAVAHIGFGGKPPIYRTDIGRTALAEYSA